VADFAQHHSHRRNFRVKAPTLPVKISAPIATTINHKFFKMGKKMKLVSIDEEDKGEAIRFLSGKYAGGSGWMDKSQGQPPVMCHVIVDNGNGKGYYTSVDRRSVAEPFAKPNSQLSSAVQQVAKLEVQFAALCSTLVMCQIDTVTPELIDLLERKLLEAFLFHNGTKGRPSKRYDIDLWNDDAINDADTIMHPNNK
jgi:hypothetical protein